MKKIKFLLILVGLALFSCDDYLDVNTSPNNPNISQISPDLALSAAQSNSYREIPRNMNRLGNFFANNWGINVNSFAATNPREFSLAIDNSFYTTIWDNTFLSVNNFNNIINYDGANYENHKAIAMILKSFYLQYMVDIYGDIPYSEAFQGSVNVTPKYDNDNDVYADLYAQVDAAQTLLNSNPSAVVVGGEDVIFAGDLDKWNRFANTLKLRLLMRQSDLGETDSNFKNTYLAPRFASLASANFLISDATINPGYSNGSLARQNPFYNLFYQINETTQNDNYRYFRASKYMGDNLNSAAAVDPRRGRIFELVGGTVAGVIQGDISQNGGGTAPATISALGPGLIINSAQNGYMISLAETNLLLAEATLKGYLPGGDAAAKAYFDAGILASCLQLGVTSANANTYISGITGNNILGKGWTGTNDDKVKSIMYQKNIALQGAVNGMEAFIELTRTGLIDNIPLATGAQQANKPRRLLYPTSEYVANSANVPAQGNVFATGPFWFVH